MSNLHFLLKIFTLLKRSISHCVIRKAAQGNIDKSWTQFTLFMWRRIRVHCMYVLLQFYRHTQKTRAFLFKLIWGTYLLFASPNGHTVFFFLSFFSLSSLKYSWFIILLVAGVQHSDQYFIDYTSFKLITNNGSLPLCCVKYPFACFFCT